MIIKKVKTSNVPDVNGAIVDSLTANVDTTTNAPSIRAVNEKLTELDANTATAISEMLDEIAGQKGYITSSEADTKINSKLAKYLPLAGGNMTGPINSPTTIGNSTWIGGVSNAALNGKYTSYGAIANMPTKSGRVSISTYPASDDNVYFGYASASQIAAGTNSFNSQMKWDAPNNILYTTATNANNASHATTAGTSTESHRPVSYAMHGATGSARWCHLGTFTSWGDASNAVIRFRGGNGYNAGVTQNSWFDIHIKDGWQETGSTTSAFGVSIIGMNYNGCSFSIRATAHNVCQVWVYFPWAYWNGDYTFTGRGTWSHVGSNQTSAPTAGVAQPIAWWDVPTAPDFTVRELRMGSIDTWNANYSGYGGGTVMFCW